MPLTQIQIIRSLGEALAWFEKELDWGVAPAELNHLTGRIGELYAAMVTRGQMATATNQRGYDVVGEDGERISVKTVTSSAQAKFNPNTLDLCDRIIVLRINVDDESGVSVETLLDIDRQDFGTRLRYMATGAIDFPIPTKRTPARSLEEQAVEAQALFDGYVISQLESGSILVTRDDMIVTTTKPVLRDLAARLGVDLLNSNDRPKNTRQLGVGVIRAISSLSI